MAPARKTELPLGSTVTAALLRPSLGVCYRVDTVSSRGKIALFDGNASCLPTTENGHFGQERPQAVTDICMNDGMPTRKLANRAASSVGFLSRPSSTARQHAFTNLHRACKLAWKALDRAPLLHSRRLLTAENRGDRVFANNRMQLQGVPSPGAVISHLRAHSVSFLLTAVICLHRLLLQISLGFAR